jgi:thioredoxin-like negative regulator of GroEL
MEAGMRVVPDAPLQTAGENLERVLATGHPALVVFEAPGCEPCLALRPILDTLARDYAGRLLVLRVAAGAGWLAARHHLCYVPTLLFFANGREEARIKGNPGEAAIRANVDFLLTGIEPPEPAAGPRHTLVSSFGSSGRPDEPRGLLSGNDPYPR